MDGFAAHLASAVAAVVESRRGCGELADLGLRCCEEGRHPGALEADARALDVVLVVGGVGFLYLDDAGELGREIGPQPFGLPALLAETVGGVSVHEPMMPGPHGRARTP